GIAPLVIDAPGESIVIDSPTFVLAGRTFKGGSVTVEGRAITVDNSGKFAQMMNISSPGETSISVRASATGHAPRLVAIKIRRVDNLAVELPETRIGAGTSYDDVASDPEAKRGTRVAFE